MTANKFDVAVLGGGGAGLASSISAAQRDLKVVVFEKSDRCGGNTARSVGSIPGAGSRFQAATGIEDSPELFLADVKGQTKGKFNHEGMRRLAQISAGLVHWLVDDVGVVLKLTQDYKHVGHSVNRLHNPPSREGGELIGTLVDVAEGLGVSILTKAPVTTVSPGPDGYTVQLESGDEFSVASVIIATDGFGADHQMMVDRCARFADLKYFGAPGNTGDGIRIGQSVGGTVDSMDSVLGYAIMGMPSESESAWDTMVSWTVVENGGVIVDSEGCRFGNEEVGYSAFVDTVVNHTNEPIYAIFDERIQNSVADHELRFKLLLERADSPVRPLSLARDTVLPYQLPRDAARRTLDAYLRAASGERADQFGRTEFGMAPLQGNLFVAKAEPSVLTTLGGLKVDGDARVLDTQGRPIESLYAAGGSAQTITGLSGASGYISGAGLLAALGYGYLAGRHARGLSR